MWPSRRLLDLLNIAVPIIQAPMAGAMDSALVVAACEAGALGALPCAMLDPAKIRSEVATIRSRTSAPFNLNFFCHAPPRNDLQELARWQARLARYYDELGLPHDAGNANRAPFDADLCALVEALKPPVVSFHFGLPSPGLVARVKASGAVVLSSATTVAEARWLEAHGVDAVIAQGAEAGGHRGMFLTEDIAAQPGTMALVPQIVDAVKVPVIASGGIADARGIVAAFALGASGVQIGTAYLKCTESKISPMHRAALAAARDDETVLTNVFTGRTARGFANRLVREQGPIAADAPSFPLASGAVAPLRAQAERRGSSDFSPLWAGQAAALGPETDAVMLTKMLCDGAQSLLHRLGA